MTPQAALESLQLMASGNKVRGISDVVLKMNGFTTSSASSRPTQHHYGTGGLVRHTEEVVKFCLLNNAITGNCVDPARMFLAALFHDVGKIWDYEEVLDPKSSTEDGVLPEESEIPKIWRGTEHKKNIHHITRSALIWNDAARQFKIENPDEILHAILAHHGLREWGSPVTPNSKMAWLLHLCDGLSARLDDCLSFDGKR